MAHNNKWLYDELKAIDGLVVEGWNPTIIVKKNGVTTKIFCAETRYTFVVADVEKAAKHGATYISYAADWTGPSEEAKALAKQSGIPISKHAETIKKFK